VRPIIRIKRARREESLAPDTFARRESNFLWLDFRGWVGLDWAKVKLGVRVL